MQEGQTPQPAGQPPATPPQQQPQAAPKGGGNVEAHRRVVLAAMKILYSSKEFVQQVIKMVGAAGDPAQGIRQATMLVLKQIGERAKGIDPAALNAAARPVAMLIAELAAKAGAIPDDMRIVQAALQGGARKPAPRPQPASAPPPQQQPQPPQQGGGGLLASQTGG